MYFSAIVRLYREIGSIPEARRKYALLRRMATITLAWLMLAELIDVAQVYPLKLFINGLQQQASVTYMSIVIGSTFAFYMVGVKVHEVMDNRRNDAGWLNWTMLWGFGHWHQMKLDTSWHTAHSTGEKESVLSRNVMKVDRLTDAIIFDALPLTLRIFFTSIGVGVIIGWQYGLLAVATMVAYFTYMWRSEPTYSRLRTDFRRYMKPIEIDGSELTANWRTIKQFGLEDEQALEHIELLNRHWNAERGRHRIWARLSARQAYIINLSRVTLYGIFAWQTSSSVSLGAVVLAISWMERVYSNYSRFNEFQRLLNEGVQALGELVEFYQEQPAITEPVTPKWPQPFHGRVEFRNVTFRYGDADEAALEGINLVIEPNQTIALVGLSGSGKTTLASLLRREYDPSSGEILIDGVDLRAIDYGHYRREGVAGVAQTVELFDASIADNIGIVRTESSRDEVSLAARQAHATEFISRFPSGLDTNVGEDGVRLSGGQRQRLAIARSLLRRPKILIFDEATSALDASSQREVQKTVDQLITERASTIIVIAHRFSTIMSADLVVLLDRGRIAEMGTHADLAKQNGIYRHLRELEGYGLFD